MNILNIYFNFKGRLPLSAYWIYWNIPMLAFVGIVTYLENQGYNLQSEYWRIANILILWPLFAITSKRLHDIDKSAWWLLLNIIPVLGSIILFLGTSFIPGSPESNRFDQPEKVTK